MDLTACRYLLCTVDAGTITRAAAQLGLSRPTLSRRLARLEERLGVRLIHRTTRRMALTAQGETLYAKARWVVAAASGAEAEVRRLDGVPRGLLRVSVPNMPEAVVAEWLAGFLEAYPQVELELVVSIDDVDIVAQGFDAALRVSPVEDPSWVVRSIVRYHSVAVASPTYLAARGVPRCLEDLSDHDCIVGYRGGAPVRHWPLRDGGRVAVSGRIKTNHMGLHLHSARQHLGIALVGERVLREDLAAGTLVAILPDVVGRQERFSLVYPDRSFLDPKVRAFADWFTSRIQTLAAQRDG